MKLDDSLSSNPSNVEILGDRRQFFFWNSGGHNGFFPVINPYFSHLFLFLHTSIVFSPRKFSSFPDAEQNGCRALNSKL